MERVKDKDMIPGKFYPIPKEVHVEMPNSRNYACTRSELREDGSVYQEFRHPETGHEFGQATYYRKLKSPVEVPA